MARILMISQVFFPDTASVSQHMTDLAVDLCQNGHDVDVLSSRNAYENPRITFSPMEKYRSVLIRRLHQTTFGKNTLLGRMMNFASFNGLMLLHLLKIRKDRCDMIIGTTVPPFLSFIGLWAAKIKRVRYCFVAMDLQPELAIVSGYLREDSLIAKLCMKMSDFIYRKSNLIIALDRFMASYIVRRGARPGFVKIIPVWPVMSQVYDGTRLSNPFRREMGFNNKIIVMYSGNMAVVHPLDTLLGTILALKDDARFLFVFIGGGVRKKDVSNFMSKQALTNIILLPLQPREKIHLSLGSADLQVVIHGNQCTGYTHPNKIYGAMFVGKPILYIGPEPSHVSDILAACPGNISVNHGEIIRLVDELRRFAALGEKKWESLGKQNREYAHMHFTRSLLCGRFIKEIEETLCLAPKASS
jgi:colanic acid biosynthesis glycosyl transferase WcaI